MEKVNINYIVDPNILQPVTGKSLNFVQNALRKDDAGIIQALVTKIVGSYSLTVPYVISGCVVSNANKNVTAGTLFYGGKFYEVVAVAGVTNVARFILAQTQDATADPLRFSDGILRNVHDIYKYVATDVASGGDFIATDLVFLSTVVSKIFDLTTLSTITTNSTTYVDLTGLSFTTPNDGISRNYLVQFKGAYNFSTSAGNGGEWQILVDGVQKDYSKNYLSVQTVNVDTAYLATTCLYVGLIAANKIIKVQARNVNSATSNFVNNTMTVTEL